jgi:hypothetical protein
MCGLRPLATSSSVASDKASISLWMTLVIRNPRESVCLAIQAQADHSAFAVPFRDGPHGVNKAYVGCRTITCSQRDDASKLMGAVAGSLARYHDAPMRCRPCALADQRHKFCDDVVRAIKRRDAGSWPQADQRPCL